MSRGLSATNTSSVDADHVHEVTLVALEFDTPVYVHSGIGSITYGGNVYLGVGELGAISNVMESEQLGPAGMTMTLDATGSSHVAEALDAGNIYDTVTIYQGYRLDDGTLAADPWMIWSGWYESASLSIGDSSIISITCQHDLAILNEKDGRRYSDEDQQDAYTGDVAFEFVHAMAAATNLLWGGGAISNWRERDTPFGGGDRQLP